MKRVGTGSIAGGEVDLLRQLVEKEYTVRSLITRQPHPAQTRTPARRLLKSARP